MFRFSKVLLAYHTNNILFASSWMTSALSHAKKSIKSKTCDMCCIELYWELVFIHPNIRWRSLCRNLHSPLSNFHYSFFLFYFFFSHFRYISSYFFFRFFHFFICLHSFFSFFYRGIGVFTVFSIIFLLSQLPPLFSDIFFLFYCHLLSYSLSDNLSLTFTLSFFSSPLLSAFTLDAFYLSFLNIYYVLFKLFSFSLI